MQNIVSFAGMCDDQMILLIEREATREREQRRKGERDKEGDGVCVLPVCVVFR